MYRTFFDLSSQSEHRFTIDYSQPAHFDFTGVLYDKFKVLQKT